MILLVVFIISLLSSILYVLSTKYDVEWAVITTFVVQCFGYLVVCIMIVLCIVIHINEKTNIESYKKKYESLVYQLENNLYDNDNDIGKKELYNQITYWNYDLAKYKELSKNVWVGIFYPNIYDQFEFIDLNTSQK